MVGPQIDRLVHPASTFVTRIKLLGAPFFRLLVRQTLLRIDLVVHTLLLVRGEAVAGAGSAGVRSMAVPLLAFAAVAASFIFVGRRR